MVHVELFGRVPGRSPDDVYAILSDFASYAGCTDAVRSITVEKDNGRAVSTWEVNFREGILRWKEQDVYLPQEHAIRFHQIEGDIDYLSGKWSASADPQGTRVAFEADFDLGVGELAASLDPIAEGALRETVQAILTCLLGDVEFLSSGSSA
jgi:ribosome-associated toxin RatA of RatAB toxin-antitoxin module